MPYVKLSISVSQDLLQKIDAARRDLGETRSGLIQRLLICWLTETYVKPGREIPGLKRRGDTKKAERQAPD